MPIIKSILSFEESEPRTCMWCAYSGMIVNADDYMTALACMHYENCKTTKKDRPLDREVRTYLKIMGSMETCKHWQPTKVGSKRMRLMEAVGLID